MDNFFIGLLSGTSMDAIDAVLVKISGDTLETIAATPAHIPNNLKQRLHTLAFDSIASLDLMQRCDVELGHCFADAVFKLLEKANLKPEQIAAIGCHGQTIRHVPEAAFPYTTQIGDPNVIAARTGITTVADFRRRDLALGGQGAPLAPLFHQWFFQHETHTRVILNIGGIANITVLEPNKPAIGYDTGPGNGLLDSWINKQLDTDFDDNGNWARNGRCDTALLEAMLSDKFFQSPAPKSTGRDYFNLSWLANYASHLAPQDIQATLTELTATSIANEIKKHKAATSIIVCGGGYHNDFLMERLRDQLSGYEINSSADYGIDPDNVEACLFAWLAKQNLDEQALTLPNITGASRDSILGAIYR